MDKRWKQKKLLDFCESTRNLCKSYPTRLPGFYISQVKIISLKAGFHYVRVHVRV